MSREKKEEEEEEEKQSGLPTLGGVASRLSVGTRVLLCRAIIPGAWTLRHLFDWYKKKGRSDRVIFRGVV